ncbi:MAG: hypothetical protein ACOH10_04485 [Rhodoglobus sp.]|uniref:hypothetical protein n=1 Tax=Salinibacterium sp. G-O1 TaxID=3046208 RepID=UPI0024BABC88|nr:hypothetical protein [Salinibacterium sp. G-O1]MDJ0334540.1 hypothetical protein [Salinibacterium sp. G-O1]
MVAQFLHLKLTIFSNTLRRGPAQLFGMALALLAGLGMTAVLAAGLVDLRSSTPDVARVIIVVFGSAIVLGFFLLPVAFGIEDPLDPRRFALLGISPTRLAFRLAVAACLSVPILIMVVLSIAQVVTWSRAPLPAFVAVVAAVVIVPTCVLAARVATAASSTFLSSSRARDGAGNAGAVIAVVGATSFAIMATLDWQSQGLPIMRRIAAVAEWTPLGSAWSAPGDAALGLGDQAALKLLLSVAFLIVLWLAWRVLVGFMLARPDRDVSARRGYRLGWFAALPDNPAGAIAARSLTYWGRDSRYGVSLAVIPVVPLLMIAALMVGGVPGEFIMWVPVPVMCLFLGWMVHNDVAHDNSAFWVHVSANTRGLDDRWGRIVPALLLGVPLIGIGSFVSVLISGDSSGLPGLIGLSACLLLAGLGISSVISAAFPYPAVHPGDGPFAQPQAVGAAGSVVQSLSFLMTIALSAPVVWLMVLSLYQPDEGLQLRAMAAGILTGVVVLIGGLLWGGYIVNKRSPELLAFTLRN